MSYDHANEWATDYDSVGEFHKKFGLKYAHEQADPKLIEDPQLQQFRLAFLEEELEELERGYATGDLAIIADALVDLVYVALGTAHLHGLPWDELFAEVQRANMAKVRTEGISDTRSARGTVWDVVKPEGWTPPDIEGILASYGYKKGQ